MHKVAEPCYNVVTEKKNPDYAYSRLLALRQSRSALRDGSYQAIDEENPWVAASSTIAPDDFREKPKGTTVRPLYSSPAS